MSTQQQSKYYLVNIRLNYNNKRFYLKQMNDFFPQIIINIPKMSFSIFILISSALRVYYISKVLKCNIKIKIISIAQLICAFK